MTSYLKRLVSSLAAYQVADVVSKFIAVLLLPVYTRYIDPAGYGVVELLANGVILISIVVRFGMIEAFIRFYYSDDDSERRDALVRRTTLFLLIATTIVSALLAAFAGPLSTVVLSHRDTTTFLVAVLGLWSFTNLELAYAVLRVDERLRLYATASLTNVLLTIAASVVLVVGLPRRRARPAARQLRRVDGRAARPVVDDAAAPVAAPRAGRADGRAAALRSADGPRRGVGLRAQHRRPLLHLPRPQPDARRALLDRGQARGRGRVHRARVPVRVAAAGLLGHRRRRGLATVRARDDLLRVRRRLGGRRPDAARAVGAAAAGGAVVL